MEKKKVVISLLGTTLDAGISEKRWDRWRPTVSLFGHNHFKIDRMDMVVLQSPGMHAAQQIARQVVRDVETVQPHARVYQHQMAVNDPWNFEQVYAALHDFAKAYAFEDDCDYYVHLTTGTHVAQICLFLLTQARYFPARLIQTSARKSEDAQPRWHGKLEVIDLNVSTYDQLSSRLCKESQDGQDALKGGIATRNPKFNEIIGRIERVALKSCAPMLFCGPTGAGKSQLAARVYDLRAKRHLISGSFVEVNCATLRGDNAMSALFGHKKGAYTGAASDRAGFLKSADNGILFLDEIGELGLDEQAMLLRALEDKRFIPLGADKEISSNFQLLAGTNRNLARDAANGRFRADLLARINVWQFTLPGLAERQEDIEPNLDFELERAGNELGLRISLTKQAREAFLSFAKTAPWHGNFRDLSACVTRMATLADSGVISADDVHMECEHMVSAWGCESVKEPPHQVRDLMGKVMSAESIASMDEFDRVQLESVLRAISQTKSMAAAGRILFAQSRLKRSPPNDTDRVRKILTSWNLDYEKLI